ncbi:condensation domain-containing protein, partial [Streptomyces sp. B6B3]|uniref:condensation domain-containing protein n=1 Tax=Streptomyces sp. B6B3 TaxID=3153570 RepID=UPI00325D1B32
PTHPDHGPLPLTPVMHELHQRGGLNALTGRFAQWVTVQVPADLRQDQLVAALQAVVDHHRILGARLVTEYGEGESGPHLDVPREVRGVSDRVSRVTATGLDEETLDWTIEDQAHAASERLDPRSGEMLRLVWFDRGPETPGRLLLAIHHLVTDAVSWQVVLSDLASAWRSTVVGRTPVLAPVTSSFRQYAHLLSSMAYDADRLAELDTWVRTLESVEESQPLLGNRALDSSRDTEGTQRQLRLSVPSDVTSALLTTLPDAFNAGVNDVLLAGLAAALDGWRLRRGLAPLPMLLNVESHGRRELTADTDVSRAVGWFTSMHPVRLDARQASPDDVRAGGADAGHLVKHVKEQLREVPGDGLGYGMLRFLNAATAPILADLPKPEIGFNYLGRVEPSSPGGGPGGAAANDWQLTGSTAMGGDADPGLPVMHVLETGGFVRERSDGPELVLLLTWPDRALDEADVRELGEGWRDMLGGLVAHASRPDVGGHTPSDLSLVTLTQGQIEEIESMFGDDEAQDGAHHG